MFGVNINNTEVNVDEDLNRVINNLKIDYSQFYRGIVVDNYDPEHKGRIKVRIPQIYGINKDTNTFIATSDIPWANCAINPAGNDSGTFLPPNIGDTVFVAFESGQSISPIYFGGVFTARIDDDEDDEDKKGVGSYRVLNDKIVEVSKDDLPEEIVNGTERIIYKSLKGAVIYIDDKDGEECIKITDQSGQSIIMENLNKSTLSRRGSSLGKNSNSQIVLTNSTGDSITLSRGKIHLKSSNIIFETDNFKQIGLNEYTNEINVADIILGKELIESSVFFTFIDMRTANPINGVTSEIYRYEEGSEVFVSSYTAQEDYLDIRLPIGNYKIHSHLEGYYDSDLDFEVEKDKDTSVKVFMTLETTEDNIQIVLTWNGSVSDIDSHTLIYDMNGTLLGHVDYSNKQYYQEGIEVVNLDVDDTSYYGPETTTINKSFRNKYLFYAYNYSGGDITNAECNVKVYDKGKLLYNLDSPKTGNGRYLTVLEYDCSLKTFRIINEISENQPSGGGN